jgi:DmsE family decaheme c-type cytochrome
VQPRFLLSTIILCCFIPYPALTQQSFAPENKSVAQYVGVDVCKTCHEDLYQKNFEKTPHFKTTLKDGHGCESCHGPGSAHGEGGGDISKIISFKDMSRQESSKQCLTCHGENHEQRHFSSSSHASSEVGCLDCHSPHHAAEPQHLLAKAAPNLCYGCHVSARRNSRGRTTIV